MQDWIMQSALSASDFENSSDANLEVAFAERLCQPNCAAWEPHCILEHAGKCYGVHGMMKPEIFTPRELLEPILHLSL